MLKIPRWTFVVFLAVFMTLGTYSLQPVSAADSKVSGLTEDPVPQSGDWMLTVDVSDTSMAATGTNKKTYLSNIPYGFSRYDSISGSSIFYITQEINDANYGTGVTLTGTSVFGRTFIVSRTWGTGATSAHVWLPDISTGVSNRWVEIALNGRGGVTIYPNDPNTEFIGAGTSIWTTDLSGGATPYGLVRLRVDPSGTTWIPVVEIPATTFEVIY